MDVQEKNPALLNEEMSLFAERALTFVAVRQLYLI